MLSAIAGAAEQSDSPFIVDVWSNKEGLPQSSVISVIQTKDGYLWLGTLNGLVRFDGNSFTKFNENNTPGLPSSRIVYLFEDSRTNLWIGTETAGIALLKDGKIQSIPLGRERQNARLISACEDAGGTVWLNTADAQVARYWNNKVEILNGRCKPIIADKSRLLWLGTGRELVGIVAPAAAGAFVVQQTIPVGNVDFLLAGKTGGYWRLADGRVQKWKVSQREKDFGTYPWGAAVVTSACEDKNGNLIVGTLGGGIFWYDAEGKYQNISTNQGLSSVFVLSLCMDVGGNLWVGTDGEGLDRVRRKAFNSPSENHSWVVQSLAEDPRGGLWMTFNALGSFRGVSYWLTNSVKDFNVGRFSNPRAVLVDHKQQVWVGTGGTSGEGLFQFRGNTFQPAPGAENLDKKISALFEDRAGQLWAGTQNGLARWNGQDWKIFTARDGLAENTISAIAEDANGNLWVGTESRGLNVFKDGKIISYQSGFNDLPGNDISCLYADKDGVVWIGTAGHGLARFQNGKWKRYSQNDGLASDSIGYIIEDGDGYLWLGSNMGLMRIKKTSLNNFVSGTTNSFFCRTYVESDGLPTRECSSGSQPAVCRTSDGRLWFPTVKGLVSVNPAELKPNPQPPLVMIESVLVEGREQKTNRLGSLWSQSITIPPGHNQLEIDYTALNFSAPKEVRFKYRLEGRDTAWTKAADARVAHYPDVPPGHYYLRVAACNEDGIWNEAGSVLEVTVQPQFWQTWWFLIAVIVFLLGMIVAGVRYVSTQKLLRQLQWLKQQEALERERSRIARDLHDQLGANLTQMTLLSEMAEADKHSPEEVESHAQQISQTARETTRSLDEIVWAVNPSNDTLEGLINYACKYAQDYLATAQLRYRVDVPNDLPAIGIPPEVRHNVFLAFKEAVNNVVKHAQASEVWIRLRLQSGSFTLEIEDNGRGIGGLDTGAPQMRNGLRNMRRRMEDIHGEFSISSGTNGGTIVRLTIPFGKQAV
jgi:ligand-binding sensor domain-containing protein/signal transduction histidine kinase